MIFNSLAFAVFLVLVFASYWWIARKGNVNRRNFFLLVVSYIFYGWWDWRFLSLIFSTSVIDFFIAKRIEAAESPSRKKAWLTSSIVMNLGLLGVFKYFNFFAGNLQELLSWFGVQMDPVTLQIVLPVGISFYTFQEMSYTLDVYRGNLRASNNIVSFLTFVAFFPQLVAGPIERAAHLMPQFETIRRFDYGFAVTGLRLMLWGFFKKVVIADVISEYADLGFAHPENIHGADVVLTALLFTIQIYCDFSGYSDIAIGTARLFGFSLMQNFRTPFFASSIRELFQRWHISLSTWFRDYVYHPLGGSRRSRARTWLNLWLVFVISGLWHGPENHYVLWGMILGTWVVWENLTGMDKPLQGAAKAAGMLRTFLLFVFAFVFFRAASVADAGTLFQNLWAGDFFQLRLIYESSTELGLAMNDPAELLYLLGLVLFLFVVDGLIAKKDFSEWIGSYPRAFRWSFYYLLIAWFLLMGGYTRPSAFIYFQF